MNPLKNRRPRFKTKIKFPGIEVKLEEVEINILDFGIEPPQDLNHCNWSWSVSVGTDRGEDNEEEHDTLVCYINADMIKPGERYFDFKINTLHTYQISPLKKYKKAHDELYKSIARESMAHANQIISKAAKGTGYEGLVLPEFDDEFLNEDASEWNKRGYIPKAAKPDKDTLGRKLKPEEVEAMSKRSTELCAWIDYYDERKPGRGISEMGEEYIAKYVELTKLNKQLWHFKLIARNTLAYYSDKFMRAMEKAVAAKPDDYLLKESYEDMKDNYLTIMDEWKDEFAKN